MREERVFNDEDKQSKCGLVYVIVAFFFLFLLRSDLKAISRFDVGGSLIRESTLVQILVVPL